MFVLTVGTGVHGFTLDPLLGEFFLTHPALRIPPSTCEFAIDASNSRFWEPAVERYVEECLAGRSGPRGKDFHMRWIASLVAETHRILMRGGVFLDPRGARAETRAGQPTLLHAANPVAFVIEQAQGRAITGRGRVLDVQPESLQQRTGLIFGSPDEVERIERYHRDHNLRECDAPLFGTRGLFRVVI
jgi:fructose-1,6-bisphosphatase I/sedoheptulose-1,7-bisphosphatase